MKLGNIKLHSCGIEIIRWPFQVQVRSCLSAKWIVYTDTVCLGLGDPEKYRPVNMLALLTH